jgi:hypothetical protein
MASSYIPPSSSSATDIARARAERERAERAERIEQRRQENIAAREKQEQDRLRSLAQRDRPQDIARAGLLDPGGLGLPSNTMTRAEADALRYSALQRPGADRAAERAAFDRFNQQIASRAGDIFATTDGTGGGGGGGGGVRGISFTPLSLPQDIAFNPLAVDRNLYQLEESAAERQALIDARADLDARARAGAEAIVNTWRSVEETNRTAASKARQLAEQYGQQASGLWTNAANQAREASVLRAAAVMANEGRAPIDLDPMAGGGAFVAAMESLARPEAERAFLEGSMQAERSEFAGDIAAAQSASYRGELQRTSMIMAADMAREHNSRVLERIGRERAALQQAESQTGMFNRQLQAQTDVGNLERRMGAEQFNIENRLRADQFNAQLRAQAAAAAGSRQPTDPFKAFNDVVRQAVVYDEPSILISRYPNMNEAEARRYMSNLNAFLLQQGG